MAFECPEVVDFSTDNSSSNCSAKEACISLAAKNLNHAEKLSNKGIVSKKGVAKSNCGFSHDKEKTQTSITDLPLPLVLEILNFLDAKDLGIVSCVSTLFQCVVWDHRRWKDIYVERWGLPIVPASCLPPAQKSWKELVVEREFRSRSFMGRYSVDVLRGHKEAVRSVFLLAQEGLIFTGGYDMVVRMWDMEDGLSVAVSCSLGCTIRAITADTELLVAGGTDSFLQCWRAVEGHPHLFDVAGTTIGLNSDFRLWGHEGPVTCLALDSSRIYSGSWDMTVRVWDRSRLKCSQILRHSDWVWALSPRGSTVASTAGTDAYVWDIESGELNTVICNAHAGNAQALTRSHSGDILFTGGEDGAIHMFDFDIESGDVPKRVATWIPHTGQVHSLAFEYPWVISSSSDGRLALINVGKLLKLRHSSLPRPTSETKQHVEGAVVVEPPQRMLHGFHSNLFSVHVGADRIVCGGEEGVVRVWDFSEALKVEKRARDLRRSRQENRMRRQCAQHDMTTNDARRGQCSVAAKRDEMKNDRNGLFHCKCPTGGKLKA